MGYFDIFIPLFIAIVAISIPHMLIREDHPEAEKRIVRVRKAGYILIGVAIIYGIIRILS